MCMAWRFHFPIRNQDFKIGYGRLSPQRHNAIVAAGGAIILIGTAGCGFYGLTHNSSSLNSFIANLFIANLFPKLSHNNDIQYWKR